MVFKYDHSTLSLSLEEELYVFGSVPKQLSGGYGRAISGQ